jgi:ATP-dependent Clp protease adaptor protein ClpS
MSAFKHSLPHHVVLLDDDDHSYEYVIEMLHAIFGYEPLKGLAMAREVDLMGRVIVATTSIERAQEACDRIHAYGPDRRMPRSRGPMQAIVEPAV